MTPSLPWSASARGRRSRPSRVPALAVTALAALLVPTAALAGIKVRSVDTSAYPNVRVTVLTSEPSVAAPALKEAGKDAAGLRAENLGRAKSVVLAVDRSRSMKGGSLDDALAAARAFIGAKPAADRVAVVVFGSSAVQLTDFSSSTIDADTALRTVSIDGRQGTALYDAVELASRMLKGEKLAGRVILLVTDGTDVSSQATLEASVAAARKARALVYPVGIEGPQFAPDALRAIARRTGGVYRAAATSADLREVYAAVARELKRTWRLEYLTAARPGERLPLEVSVAGAGTAAAEVSVPEGVGDGSSRPKSLLPREAFESWGVLAVAGTVGLIVLFAWVLMFSSKDKGRLSGRLAPHVGQVARQRVKKRGRDRFEALAGLFKATEKAFGHTKQWVAVQRLLMRADVPLKTVEFFYLSAGCGLLVGLFAAATGSASIVILAAMGLGGLLPFGVVGFKAKRRIAAFENQLPDMLISLAASLKAGHSFKQALQSLVDEGMEPASKELKRVLTETRLGRPTEDALAEMAERVGSKNFSFIITAVNVQSQVGGSLAGLFDLVSDTVRQRQQFARKIKGLTAMGRMSAYVLIGLPFVVALALTAMNPEYMSPLYHTSAGHKLMAVGLLMMGFGSVLLKKIVSFRS